MREALSIAGFSGLDLVTPPAFLSPERTPSAFNVRLVGGALQSLHEITDADITCDAHDGIYFNDSGNEGVVIYAHSTGWQFQAATSAWNALTTISTGAGTSNIDPPSAASRDTTFYPWVGKVYALSPSHDVYVVNSYVSTSAPEFNLATYAPGANTGPPRGRILGVYGGRMWVATGGANGMEIAYSNVADNTNGFVNATGIWPDANRIVLGSGVRSTAIREAIVAGYPTPDGLVVFTNLGVYLIYDSDDGFNTLVDANGGLTDRRALASRDDMLYGINERGVWRTNGRLPLEYISDAIRPFFDAGNGWKSSCEEYNIGFHPGAGMVYDGSYFVTITPRDHPFVTDPTPTPGGADFPRLTIEVNLESGAVMWHTRPLDGRLYIVVPPHREGLGPYISSPEYVVQVSPRVSAGAALRGCLLDMGVGTATGVASQYDIPLMSVGERQFRLQRISAVGLRTRTNGGPQVSIRNPLNALAASVDPGAFRWSRSDHFPLSEQSDRGFVRVSGYRGKAALIRLSTTTQHAWRMQQIDVEIAKLARRHP